MSVIMIIHILTTLSATQLHHYAYEMQMKYLRKIWIINALHIIMLSCLVVLCSTVDVDRRCRLKSECELQANLYIESWLLFITLFGLLWFILGVLFSNILFTLFLLSRNT